MTRIAAANPETGPKRGTSRRLLRHVAIGLLLAAAAYFVCAMAIQAAGPSPAGDPAKRAEPVMQLMEPVMA